MFQSYGKKKPTQAVKPQTNEKVVGTLYYRVGKNGTETNFLDWYRSWKDYKITEFAAEYRETLREFKRKQYDMDAELTLLQNEPLLPISKDYWIPEVSQIALLTAEADETRRGYLERRMFGQWATTQATINADIKTRNENKKKQRDEIISRGGEARKTTISTIIGSALADMSIDSRQKVITWKRASPTDPADPQKGLIADDMEEAYEKQDWLFVFEAAMATHLQVDAGVDETAVLQRQEKQLEKLKTTKHEFGSLEKWILRFEDQLDICDALQCNVTDNTKRLYFMENLNPKIFEQTLIEWKSTLTRASFPKKYEELKTHIINEYNAQMTDDTRTKIIMNVIKNSPKKPNELSMQTNEKDKKGCFLCGNKNHKMKKCWYYEAGKSLEENKKNAEAKMKERAEKKKKEKEKKTAEAQEKTKKEEDHVPNKGTIAQLPPKAEKTGMCLVTELSSELYCEPCNLMGVSYDEIDFVYDTGTVSGVMGPKEKNILFNVEHEDVLIETVTGERSISKEYGDTVFGKTRILKGRRGSVLVSQYSSKDMYQVFNPNADTFILKGWEHNPKTKGKIWYFTRDEDRYGDKLLHCTIKLEKAKCFVGRETKFYNPIKPKAIQAEKEETMTTIQGIHRKWDHASYNEMVRLYAYVPEEFVNISLDDLKLWKEIYGDFCTGCIEGAMKEHPKYKSTKPLISEVPGKINVADLMFVENNQNVKKPLYVQVDVCTKYVTGVAMHDKTKQECNEAIIAVKNDYAIKGHKMDELTFDREPGVAPLETTIKEHGIELHLKAAGQKAALAEVNIRNIRVKARKTKAGVREKYKYLPPNQFNMDLCLDSIQVMNRIPKINQEKSPYELFTGKKVDYLRDFRAEWGETIIAKKPKGIASDLNVTGEWAVVVRRIMNGTGVLKVYLINSRKYAYRLQFQRAIAPKWVLDALEQVSNRNTSIGFEDEMKMVPNRDTSILDLANVNDDEVTRNNINDMINDDEEEIRSQTPNTQENETPMVLMRAIDTIEEVLDIANSGNDKDTIMPIPQEETVNTKTKESGLYTTRSGRVVKPPQRYGFEEAFAVVQEWYKENYHDIEVNEQQMTIEIVGMMKAMLFQHAMNQRPDEAMKALREEVQKALKINIWKPKHWNDLTKEEKKFVIPMMINYLEKYKPDNTFDKFKVRVLNRGDKQFDVGESEGPVARVESIMMLLSIAAYEDFAIFKVDIGSAFMRTPMVDDVKHKWVRLDKLVVKILQELRPGEYDDYILHDGTMVMELTKISYGLVEAAHYWYKDLRMTFEKNDYKPSKKDKCVFICRSEDKVAFCATTVDDCFFVTTNNETWMQQQIHMLKNAYEVIEVEQGDELGLIGMQVKMDRSKKQVILTQPKFVQSVIDAFGISKGAPSPALNNMMADDEDSALLHDQREFMSLNSLLMYGAMRTYPEIRPAVIRLSTKYNRANELDLNKATRVAEYIYGCKEEHKLILAPKSMKAISAADASYGEHADGKSHSGGTVGFESDTSCNFAFVSGKQPVVAKSVGEAELIAENKVGDYVEWSCEMLDELGYPQECVPMYVDSTCAMQMLKQGTGSFKRAKHIKVRFFWMKDLIDAEKIKLIYVPTEELVADILTKPMSGGKFQYLLFKLIGWNHTTTDHTNYLIGIKEVAEEVC